VSNQSQTVVNLPNNWLGWQMRKLILMRKEKTLCYVTKNERNI